MIRNKALFVWIVASLIPYAHANQAFFDKIESIKKDLYKIPTDELPAVLGITPIEIPIITALELEKELSSATNLRVINVLPEKYYDDCHIKGSINAPLKELVLLAQTWDRSEKIVVYCAFDACDAGQKGCILLSCMGFTTIYDYKGGIKEWFQLGYPTEGPALEEYLHTKSIASIDHEYELYPQTIVCSRQTRWSSRYEKID